MIQLLMHLWGDYIIQNNWMANNKTKFTKEGWLACLIHCLTYSLPFLLLPLFGVGLSVTAWLTIFITHFFIDKFRLAKYLLQFKNWTFTETGFSEQTPPFLAVWLLIIVDNIIHVTINYFSITYL